jgi:NADP-dependent 3-hydroxy acid dehydrogenase YdfG
MNNSTNGLRGMQGKVAIVTGASSGIGRATAAALAGEGAWVVLAARREAELCAVAEEVRAAGGRALIVPTDVEVQEQVERLVAQTVAEWGRLDIVVANAGAYVRARAQELTLADLQRSMDVNFYGAARIILAALPQMLAQHAGHIVIMSSLDGRVGLPMDAPYAAAKFALHGLADSIRGDLYGTGVAVTTVFPGRVDTPLIDDLTVPAISAKLAPAKIARRVIRAIYRREAEVIVPAFSGRLLDVVNALAPRVADWFVRRLRLEGWRSE